MAKGDPTKDYYAVLGIQTTATEKEISKAFRQRALLYHPDRNAGREQEVLAKFQDAQAAHEVLMDPLQRAKYDADRRKLRNVPSVPPYTPRNRPPPAASRNSYTTTPSGTYYARPPPPKPQPNMPRPAPHQHYSSYANGADRFTNANFRAPPTAQRPESKQKQAEGKQDAYTAWQKMKKPKAEGTRTQNQNNPNGTPFGRSKSTRAPSDKKGFNPGTPGGDEGQAKSSYRSNYDRPDASPATDQSTSRVPKTNPVAEDVPFAEANRFRTPYSSTKSGERTSMYDEGIGRSASVRNSPTYAQRAGASTEAGNNSDSGRRQRPVFASFKKVPIPHMYDSSDESEAEVFRTGTSRPKYPPTEQQQASWAQGAFKTPQQKSGPPNGTSPNPFKSRSEENFHFKFSPSDWHGKFEGAPDNYFAPNIQKGAASKGRTSPTRGRQHQRSATERGPLTSDQSQPPPVSPFAQPQSSQMPPPPPGPPPTSQEPHATKFAPEEWANTFKESSWAFPKETSPRRGSAAPKRANPARKASVPPENNAGTAKQASKPKAKYQAFAEDATNGDAMDIDLESPAVAATKTKARSPSSGIPQWSPMPKSAETGAKANGSTKASPAGHTVKPATSGIDLTGMNTVEPFMQTSTGFSGLADLGDELPFPSQPSSAHPTKPANARRLKFPNVPLAPTPPSNLDPATTDAYFVQMEGYIRQYMQYKLAMAQHFIARNEEANELDDNFVRQRGERTQKMGFTSYAQTEKEDEGVLEAWKVGHERHLKALDQCEDIRRKAAKLARFSSV